jgi:hypothetical protein
MEGWWPTGESREDWCDLKKDERDMMIFKRGM